MSRMILNIFDTTLPLDNEVLKFLLILSVILLIPLLFNKIKIPQLLGLILAGALIGPNGFYLMERDSSIMLSGTAGLLYIMFLAGLEIDLADFKKNSKKSVVFGLYTFIIPISLGTAAGLYILNYSPATAILLASMFASHTLIAYPMISKMGVAKNPAVNITVGGTMITDTLALLVLAVIVGMTTGEVNAAFWIRLSISILIFALIVMLIFPIFGRWFLKRFEDSVTQYIFVLVMVFLGATLAELAGIEAIIGAFLVGLALNRLILRTSPLMNRIEFVGNAIFIPFFLISVGMLIDYRAFVEDAETLKVAAMMIIVGTGAKFIAAWLTQKTYNFSNDERRLIFGLSNAQAAATLAAVLVGYNIVLGETDTGAPIRLLNESILNGTILMILFTCTIASFEAQKGAQNILNKELDEPDPIDTDHEEKILIPISNQATTEELVNLGITIKSKKNTNWLFGLTIVDNKIEDDEAKNKAAKKILHKAEVAASATDNTLHPLLRYDINIVNGITSVVKENGITDLILGLYMKKGISDSFLGNLTEGILKKCNTTTFIYKPTQPFGTLKRHLIIIPENAEKEEGFPYWLSKIWNIAKNSGAKLIFFATHKTLKVIKEVNDEHPVESEFHEFSDWDDFLVLAKNFESNDNLIIILSRKGKPSYHGNMDNIPTYLNNYFKNNSFILIYPKQESENNHSANKNNAATKLAPIEKLDVIGKTLAKIFGRKG